MTIKKQIELGDAVKDLISGFQGVAVAKTEWLNGCIRWTLQPESMSKDGASKATETFDAQQLDVIKKHKVASVPVNAPLSARPGGPRPSPKRATDPKGMR